MRYSGIYKITNPRGRIYIGQSVHLFKRKKNYITRKGISEQVKIYNSIKKYGWDNHIWEIIELCCVERLNERERYWQDFYNV